MNCDQWLSHTVDQLNKAHVSTAWLDTLVLLEDATGKNRAWLLAHPEFELSDKQVKKLEKQIDKRTQYEPLAYIRGKTEFYGREFYIDYRVLQPRSESEIMIELLKALHTELSDKDETHMLADIGTGSGALAITAKLEIPQLEVIATDIDQACLMVGRKNARNLQANVNFRQGNLLEPIYDLAHNPSPGLIMLCNLPYVPDAHTINQAAMHEPAQAIFGGVDGLDLYRQLFAQTKNLPMRVQRIFTESLPPQHEALALIAKNVGYAELQEDNFIQVFIPS